MFQVMVLLTVVGRSTDGLPLAISIPTRNKEIDDLQIKVEKYLKKTIESRGDDASTISRVITEDGDHTYFVHSTQEVSCVTVAHKSLTPSRALAFLEEIAKEFIAQHHNEFSEGELSPYHFVQFEERILEAAQAHKDDGVQHLLNATEDAEKVNDNTHSHDVVVAESKSRTEDLAKESDIVDAEAVAFTTTVSSGKSSCTLL